jgi:hypothetical protein
MSGLEYAPHVHIMPLSGIDSLESVTHNRPNAAKWSHLCSGRVSRRAARACADEIRQR